MTNKNVTRMLTTFYPQDLDIQYTIGLVNGVNVTEYFVGREIKDGVHGFLDEALFLADLDELPQVITTSYAHQETAWDFAVTE